jgi:hypothetical protein
VRVPSLYISIACRDKRFGDFLYRDSVFPLFAAGRISVVVYFYRDTVLVSFSSVVST